MNKQRFRRIPLYRRKFLDLILKIIDYFYLKTNYQVLMKPRKIISTFNANVLYLIENRGWAIYWDAKYIIDNLKKFNLIDAEISTDIIAKNKIIHWGSVPLVIRSNALAHLDPSNINILTWFHVLDDDKKVKFIPILNKKIDIFHTASNITKTKLINHGILEEKIVVTPTGVDINLFKRFSEDKRKLLKKKYNLPQDKFIIGSFVKDGTGWGDGLEPKYIKGPDIFCEVVKKLNENYDIHIFITGPSRGYVKNKLKEYNVPYTFTFLRNYFDMVECYNAIDLYLITSRVEGGPKGSLEAIASGVPVVATSVGWIPELITNGVNGYLAAVDDIDKLYEYSAKLINSQTLRNDFIENGLKIIKKYSWENVAKNYYQKIYKKVLNLDKLNSN